jgi:hypothetical protein
MSPIAGARPSSVNVSRAFGDWSCPVPHPFATTSVTGNPFSAWWIAGLRIVPKGSFPNRARSTSHPATAPGTVTEYTPREGIRVMFLDARNSGVRPLAAQPLAFRP